jgi:ABC-2 type transport system ATP-binding protein
MNVLEIENIRKEFGTLVAVNDVSISVQQGSVVGLIGPNGAGKTTLLRILATILVPTSGNASILGCDLRKDYLQIRRHLGFLPDFFNLYNDLTLRECLEFFAKVYKVEPAQISDRIDTVLKFIDLEDKRDDFVRHLSRGMVQRLGVGILLVRDCRILLLDEPASGLDPMQRIKLREILKKLSTEGKTTIISSHILTELSEMCSHIAIMNKGKMVLYGAVDEIQQKITCSRSVEITVLDNCDKAASLIKGFSGTEIINIRGNIIAVAMRASLEELAELNAHLVKNNIGVVSFCEKKTGLEDIFMKVSADR